MHIVGGLYRELCDVPFWDSTLGSGGRAALAANALASGVEFSTYASPLIAPHWFRWSRRESSRMPLPGHRQ